MIHKSGLSNTIKSNSSPKARGGSSSSSNTTLFGRVVDVIMDENHPQFSRNGNWNGLGTIFVAIISSTNPAGETKSAKPYFPQIKNYPLKNELVQLFSLPVPTVGSDNFKKEYYYLPSYNIWNTPHYNALPIRRDTIPNSQTSNYQQVESGIPNVVDDSPNPVNLIDTVNSSQNTFIERSNIHPLLPYMGDIIYEGRFGNSIRLGSTSKSDSQITNIWSEVGENGNPITIIRNGQSEDSSDEGWIPITEDINKDLSSIYLTSNQKLDIDASWDSKFKIFNSFGRPVSLPNYFGPQILLNANRIVLNAKTDSILISSEQSFNVSVGGYTNINSLNLYVDAQVTKLGSKNANESVLKGDTTVKLLQQLTKAIKDLATILEVDKKWPGGNLQTGYNAVAGNVLLVLNDITTQLENDSLKSKTTKVL